MRAALTMINAGLSVTDGAAPLAGGGDAPASESPR